MTSSSPIERRVESKVPFVDVPFLPLAFCLALFRLPSRRVETERGVGQTRTHVELQSDRVDGVQLDDDLLQRTTSRNHVRDESLALAHAVG